jgi:beta-phosphoglucomutase-like phosphatase (HAD superfamily)
VVPGLCAYLGWLDDHGVRVARVSSADRIKVVFEVGVLQLEYRLPARVLAEDVTRGNPDPKPFLLGADRLGLAEDVAVRLEKLPLS